MVGINLKVLYARIQGPTIIWVLFFLFGITIGFLSGIERSRAEDKRRKQKMQ
jgi:ABC-type antimicrobial peptide transport system permease subunit